MMSGSNPAAPSSFAAPVGFPDSSRDDRCFPWLECAGEWKDARLNAPGLCLKGVNDSMEAMGLKVHRRPSAYMALEDLRKDPHFQEVQVSKSKLDSLPAGAIVVWGQGKGLPHGHISATGAKLLAKCASSCT